jgi:hypothetical protein
MKILSKKPFVADGVMFIPLAFFPFAMPPVSLKNPATIFCCILLMGVVIFSILPHLRMVELNQEGGSVSWFGVKRNFKWKELEVITYGDIGVVRGERWEGIFFSNKALTPKGKRMTTIERIYFSLNIFEQFFVIFNDEKEKEQIMNQLKEWGVNVIIDTDFAQRKEYERILEEKTKMREERKRLYEERKKRKQ